MGRACNRLRCILRRLPTVVIGFGQPSVFEEEFLTKSVDPVSRITINVWPPMLNVLSTRQPRETFV